MGRGVSSGGGQSSLGYLFGGDEAPKSAERPAPVQKPAPSSSAEKLKEIPAGPSIDQGASSSSRAAATSTPRVRGEEGPSRRLAPAPAIPLRSATRQLSFELLGEDFTADDVDDLSPHSLPRPHPMGSGAGSDGPSASVGSGAPLSRRRSHRAGTPSWRMRRLRSSGTRI
ncbi:hypothetical protein E2562_028653 [Oryza meyeriana var. granulata]|uniref:Uncharacterized protein n=1 Tax=Oryza meyeriana var. granulata TaxID=110450 RepID=A0A6G1BNG8_9ORYZ|nr:hypothetical protein E2562_028653 [Oryza meyeriana var. granulata]